MCFSAGASFAAGTILSIVGVVAINKTDYKKQFFFAATPLLFAVQQFAEGFLWLSLLHNSFAYLQQAVTYVFLVFALVVWPLWIPFSILLLEKVIVKRRILLLLLGTGILVSVYFAFRLITQSIHADIIEYHISYYTGPRTRALDIAGIFYFITTFISPLVSSVKKMRYFAASIALTYLITGLFYQHFMISVWCFFEAVTSAAVFFIILDLHKSLTSPNHTWWKPGIQPLK